VRLAEGFATPLAAVAALFLAVDRDVASAHVASGRARHAGPKLALKGRLRRPRMEAPVALRGFGESGSLTQTMFRFPLSHASGERGLGGEGYDNNRLTPNPLRAKRPETRGGTP